MVGKHMSGTHLAMASYRVQCLLGQLGQAAGTAGALRSRRWKVIVNADVELDL